MGFSNIGKHKYSWVLDVIRCVYLKVDRWYLNKIRCDKKKYPNTYNLTWRCHSFANTIRT